MGIAAFGTLFKMGDGASPENFTTIAEVTDISGPELGTDTEDGTHHSSTGGYEEVIATILRTGTVTLTIQYDPTDATHDASTGLIYEWTQKTTTNYQLVFPDTSSTTWTLPCKVTGFTPAAPVGGKLTAEVTLKVDGQPTLA
jgi:hypothetical protein